MRPRSPLLLGMLLPACVPLEAGTRPPTVEIAPALPSSPGGPGPAPTFDAEDAPLPVEPAVSPKIPGTTDKHAGSVGLGFASPSQGDVKSSCTLNGKKLWGKVQVVDAFADLKVKKVDAFADACGKWQFVTAFPDFKVQFVTAFPDLKIRYVDAFPGND